MEEKRGHWDSRFVFVMATIGSAVGLGNIWRFPYVCYENGGGAFLIPFLVALFTAGVPLLILEFALGHKMQKAAPMALGSINKNFEWLGWFAVIVGLVVMTYYGVIMGWCFNYLYHSFSVAWAGNEAAFFTDVILRQSDSIGEIGGVVPHVLFGTFLCWLIVFFCIYKGVKSVGKVVMITVPLPILILIILVIRGVTLPNALDGIEYYLTPNFEALKDPRVWLAAYGQVFFSVTIGFGVMIAYASFLPRKSDIVNNAFITALADAGVSFLAGFAVFSALGYLAFDQSKAVSDVVSGGPGLAFVTYPTILALLPFGAKIFSVIFFLLLLTLGIDSAFSLVEAGVAGALDKWKYSRVAVNATVSFVAFLIGVLFSTNAGVLWLDIFDHYLNNYGLTTVGFLECIFIGYVFGADKIRKHVNLTSEIKVGIWFDICIKFITPVILLVMFFRTAWIRIQNPYGEFPAFAQFLGGWGMMLLLLVVSIVLMVMKSKKADKGGEV